MTLDQSSTKLQLLSRRDALKALAAIGGAAAASALLPEKWVKPVVEAGVLPAHAQTSVCSPPFTFYQCSDNVAFWNTKPSLVLVIDSMAYLNTRCEGVPLLFSFVIKNEEGRIIYSSRPKTYLTNNHGFAEPLVAIPVSQMSGTPYLVITHWEFANPEYGEGNCSYVFGINPVDEQ